MTEEYNFTFASERDLASCLDEIQSLLLIPFSVRESEAHGGIYYRGRGPMFRDCILKENRDMDRDFPAEDGLPLTDTLLYVSTSNPLDLVERLKHSTFKMIYGQLPPDGGS